MFIHRPIHELATATSYFIKTADVVIERIPGTNIARAVDRYGNTIAEGSDTFVLKEAVNKGGLVVVLGGIYNIDDTIVIPPRTRFIGINAILYTDKPIPIIEAGVLGQDNKGIEIAGFRIWGNYNESGQSGQVGIKLNDINQAYVHDVVIDNIETGIEVNGVYASKIKRVMITFDSDMRTKNDYVAKYGIKIRDGDKFVSDMLLNVIDVVINGCMYGVYAENMPNGTWRGCLLTNCGINIYIKGNNVVTRFVGCSFDSCKKVGEITNPKSVYITAEDRVVQNIVFDTCWITTTFPSDDLMTALHIENLGYGIYTIIISNCYIKGQRAMYVKAFNVRIDNSIVEDASNNNTYYTLEIDAPATFVHISNSWIGFSAGKIGGIKVNARKVILDNVLLWGDGTPINVVSGEVLKSNILWHRLSDDKDMRFSNGGIATFTGDGSTTQFKIAHGLVSAPKVVIVTPKGSTPKPDSVDWDDTYIYINYSTAPAAGTTLVFSWFAEC